MALKGTLRDFGIADILQLIGHQGKTGVLVLKNDVDEIRVWFRDGAVVKSDSATRPAERLLGKLMLRAGVISEEQLERALELHKESLRRVGTILTEMGAVRPEDVAEFATLQMTETIYSLFGWSDGVYEFDADAPAEGVEGVAPIKAESLVMNGIRMVDEWPAIREKLPSYGWRVDKVRGLPPAPRGGADATYETIGSTERTVFGLIKTGATVQDLVDASRLGEFETCLAVCNLMSSGYLRVVKPQDDKDGARSFLGGAAAWRRRALWTARFAVSAGLTWAGSSLLWAAYQARQDAQRAPVSTEASVLHRRLAEGQLRLIQRALELFRVQHGFYPKSLQALVDAQLVTPKTIHFPFERPYFYRVNGEAYTLLRPLH